MIGAHSYGATVATLFTQAYPDDVVGLLFVDPQSPRVTAGWRDALPAPAADEPASVTDFRDELETFETDPSLNPEHVHLRPSFAEAAAALDAPGPLFGDRPVVVLSAETTPGPQLGLPPDLAKTIDDIWAAGQQELADESTAGSLETVSGAGHEIQVDQPPAVIDALERILARSEGLVAAARRRIADGRRQPVAHDYASTGHATSSLGGPIHRRRAREPAGPDPRRRTSRRSPDCGVGLLLGTDPSVESELRRAGIDASPAARAARCAPRRSAASVGW